ncbi:hypothetical protein [Nostoc sp. MG11]|uniref:hypothetical protein n=1 Tax=Nostoc sp. MG11 TaxID=2721166 RepID=UPI001865ADA7|nr:hypothetical protein [Nostoc sp. MG11]
MVTNSAKDKLFVLIFDLSNVITVFKNKPSIGENLRKLGFVNRTNKAIKILVERFYKMAGFYGIRLPPSSKPQIG